VPLMIDGELFVTKLSDAGKHGQKAIRWLVNVNFN
jgi:hypothetical protein